MSQLLEKRDKDVTLKYLLEESKFNPSESFSIPDWEIYKSGFEKRNGKSLEVIQKSLKDQGVTEVNEQDIDKVFSLLKVSKAEDLSPAAEGIIFALGLSLNWLYGDSKWILDRFTNAFTGNPDNADMVKLINNFNFTVKSVKDNLTFITFNNGAISGVPILKSKSLIKKCYDDWDYYYNDPMQVDEWDIREINYIEYDLGIAINLLDALIKIFPVNSDFSLFKTELETALSVINDFNDNFKDIVILANSLDIIRVTPKTITAKEKPVVFYQDNVAKSKSLVKKSRNMQVVKSDVEGLVLMVVIEPETLDSDGNFASKEVISKAYYDFMLNWQQFDVMHDLQVLKSTGDDRQIALTQAFLAPQDLTYEDRVIKSGAFMLELKYFDEEILSAVIKRGLNGASLYGFADIDPTDLVPAT